MKSYDAYMAESGQQSTLDEQRRNFTYDKAKAAYESGGGGGGVQSNYSPMEINIPSVDEYINAIQATLPKPPPKYTDVNPFYFDEKNAEDLATAEFSPYYDELVTDYMGDVDKTKERLGNDNTKILSEMASQKDYFMEKSGTELERTLRGIKEGYEASGMYFSGNNQRTQNETQADYQTGINDYMRQFTYKKTGQETDVNRQLEDLTTQGNRYTRDIGREKSTAIAGNVGQQKGEAIDEYLLGAKTYYENPNWGSMI